MTIGPDQIVACPSCKGLAKYETLGSWNACDERVWTDGKRLCPPMSFAPMVVKCRHCGKMYLLSEARHVGQVERWVKKPQKIRPSWLSAEHVQEPEEFEYYQAIRSGLARTREQKFRLRSYALRRSNDAHRDFGTGASMTPEQ